MRKGKQDREASGQYHIRKVKKREDVEETYQAA